MPVPWESRFQSAAKPCARAHPAGHVGKGAAGAAKYGCALHRPVRPSAATSPSCLAASSANRTPKTSHGHLIVVTGGPGCC